MNFRKIVFIIIVSFSLGVGVSRSFIRKNTVTAIKEPGEHHEGEKGHGLELSKKSQGLIDIRVQKAEFARFTKKVPVIGQISQDPESSTHVTVPLGGILYDCKAKIGAKVEKGELICVIKSDGSFMEIKSPVSGIIMSDFFKIGDKVNTVSSLHTIADLSKLWAILNVYEKDIADIKLGQKIIARSVAYPEEAFEGEVTFISPRVDEDTHTIKVRVIIQNPNYLLKMGMSINADIVIESENKFIVLPQDAVQTINDCKFIFVKTAADKFEEREVKVHDENEKEAAIAEGVGEGEEVVVKDGFFLKSEFLKSKMGEGCAD